MPRWKAVSSLPGWLRPSLQVVVSRCRPSLVLVELALSYWTPTVQHCCFVVACIGLVVQLLFQLLGDCTQVPRRLLFPFVPERRLTLPPLPPPRAVKRYDRTVVTVFSFARFVSSIPCLRFCVESDPFLPLPSLPHVP